MSKQKSVKLNVYLLKKAYALGNPIIADGKMTESEVEIPNGGEALLYTTQSGSKPPGWANFLAPLESDAIKKLRVGSASVVLIIPAAGRHFAACFGHGYAYIDKQFIEARFGLRTCLNVIDHESIRTLDKRTFDSIGKLSQEQSTRPVPITEFGLEVDRDLLRSVVGKPRDEAFGSQIAGRDSVGTSISISLDRLPSFLRKCLQASQRDTYKQHFEFIDNIADVSDPAIQKALDALLVESINNDQVSKIWLAVPEIINWQDIAGFKFSAGKNAEIHDDIILARYLDAWSLRGSLTVEALRLHRVYQIGSDGATIENSWLVHHCLYAELGLDDETYILTEGTWYKVDQNFVKSVQAEIDAIPKFKTKLADWGDEHEQHYNERLVKNSSGQFALMDRKMISHGGGSSSIEFCDVLTSEGDIIHIKHYSGSSVLSHLFQQGTVSAFMTAGDMEFRKKVNAILPTTHKLPESSAFATSNFQVVYAIGTRDPIGFDMPFFSKVSLRNSVRQLRVSGYRVAFTTIKRTKLAKLN